MYHAADTFPNVSFLMIGAPFNLYRVCPPTKNVVVTSVGLAFYRDRQNTIESSVAFRGGLNLILISDFNIFQ